MREKRRFIRFYIALKVEYIIRKEPRAEKVGTTKDVSAAGMQLLTNDKMEVGDKVDLNIFVPEALNPAHMEGIVVWSRELLSPKSQSYSTGIEFGKIEEDNKNTFLKFLCDLMYEKIGEKHIGS